MTKDSIENLFWTCYDHHIVMMMMIYHKFDELLIKFKIYVLKILYVITLMFTSIIVHKHNTKEQAINLLI